MELMPGAQSSLNTIAIEANGEVIKCCSLLFSMWLQRQPDASWGKLIEALTIVGLHKVAMEIERKLESPTDRILESYTVLKGMIFTKVLL